MHMLGHGSYRKRKPKLTKEEEAAALEFGKRKGEFSVDDEATLEEEEDSTEDLLVNFFEYIKDLDSILSTTGKIN